MLPVIVVITEDDSNSFTEDWAIIPYSTTPGLAKGTRSSSSKEEHTMWIDN